MAVLGEGCRVGGDGPLFYCRAGLDGWGGSEHVRRRAESGGRGRLSSAGGEGRRGGRVAEGSEERAWAGTWVGGEAGARVDY